MSEKPTSQNFISLSEAATYCNYSQEYLSLRARQGKLRAEKIGRNWLTKKEWIQEYIIHAEEWKNGKNENGNGVDHESEPIQGFSQEYAERMEKFFPPENLPIEGMPVFPAPIGVAQQASSFVSVLQNIAVLAGASAIVIAGGIAGQESIASVYEAVQGAHQDISSGIEQISQVAKKEMEPLRELFANLQEGTLVASDVLRNHAEYATASIAQASETLGNETDRTFPFLAPAGDIVWRYWDWLGENLGNSYIALNDILEEGIRGDMRQLADLNERVAQGIQQDLQFAKSVSQGPAAFIRGVRGVVGQGIELAKKGISVVISPWSPKEESVAIEEKEEPQKEEKPEETIKEVEVSRVTQVQPIREITKEVHVLDSEELAQIKSDLAKVLSWRGDIDGILGLSAKLQTSPPQSFAPTAPVYIGSPGLQVGGNANFASLGVSGEAGVRNLGVGRSATFGENTTDRFTVKSTASFTGPVTLSAGFTVSGDASFTGNVTLGDAAADTLTINATLATIANNLNIDDSTLFIDSANNRVGIRTITPSYTLDVAGDTYVQGSTILGDVSADAITFNASTLSVPNNFSIDGATLFIDASNNRIGVGTASPSTKLHVVEDDASTNSITNLATLDHTTSGTAAAGIGTGILFRAENTNGSIANIAQIAGSLVDATSGSEDGVLAFYTAGANGSALAERARVDSSGNVGIGLTSLSYKLDISTSTANDRGINIANSAATGTNYGAYSAVTGAATANIGGYFQAIGAATNRGLEVAAMTGATSTGLTIGAFSGTTANTGITIGAISGALATGTGITVGNISTTGITNYGFQLGTMTGGTTSNYQIATGVLTSATTTTNAQLNLGGVVTTGGTTNYGINVGALSGSGTTNYGINVTASTATGTTNYGLNVDGATGVATTNYGLRVGTVSGAATNYGILADGTWFTGGSATTTKPQLLIEPAGTTSTNWSTSGTGLGINAASGFAGDLLNAQVSGVKKLWYNPGASGSGSSFLNVGAPTGQQAGLALYLNNVETTDLYTSGTTFSVYHGGVDRLTISTGGAFTLTNSAVDTGTTALTINLGGHTNMTAEKSDIVISAHTNTITGSYAAQRFTLFNQPTISAASSLTVTTASTLTIAGAPISASSALITNAIGLQISAGTSVASGATNAYGLYVEAPVGASTVNAAAYFGGNVGIGTTGPVATLDILTPGATTGFNLAGTAPVSAAGNGTSAATNTLLVVGTAGGASSGVTGQTGGTGGALSLTSGVGGAVAGASGIGGVGGGLTLAGGAGGNGAATGGAGGAISITAGNAGTGGNANGGTLTLNSGAITGSGTSTINIGTSNSTVLNIGDSTVTKTIDIGGVTSSDASTISIATEGTAADIIAIGNTNAATTFALTGGDDWSMTATGVLTMSASAGATTAIVITDTDYTNALDIADNTITGTTANIDLTYFDVAGATGAVTIDPQTTGTYLDFTLDTAWTSGTLINADFSGGATTQGAAAMTGILLDLNGSLTTPVAGQNVTGYEIKLPVASTTSNTTTYTGFNLSTAGAITNATAGSLAWRGVNIAMPNITQSAGGSVTSSGVLITTGSITTAGTQHGVNISATGVGAGTLNGINIGTITGSGGTETALNIAAGWDTDINATTSLEIGIGGTNELFLDGDDFSPSTDAGNALGTTTLAWNGLHLNTGTAINWENSDVTITHASDALTIAGGDTFIADGNGVVIGHTAQVTVTRLDAGTTNTPEFQVLGNGLHDSSVLIGAWGTDNGSHVPHLNFLRSKNTTIGSFTVVANNDSLGSINFGGDDGTDYQSLGASIRAAVDGTPGTGDMPGRLMFWTSADGAENPSERMRITSAGDIGIATTAPDARLEINHATGDILRMTYNDSNGSATDYTDFSLSSTGALTLTGSAATLAASATAEKTFLTLTPGTITLTAPTAVTSLMETAVITGATIAADLATTVDKAAGLSLTAPIDSTSATLTNSSALRILTMTSGAGTLTTNAGLYVEAQSAGATNNYGVYIEAPTGGATANVGLYNAGTSTLVGAATINTSLLPDADDGATLGLSGSGFSDLFLASGAVINFAAGDVTLTHASDALTVGGGSLYIADAFGLVVGTTAFQTISDGGGTTSMIPIAQIAGTGQPDSSMLLMVARASLQTQDLTTTLNFLGSRGAAIGTPGIVASGDILGAVRFFGDDGVDYKAAAAGIFASVDGTPGVGDMPGRLQFYTTPDNSETLAERMRITSGGNVGIWTTAPDAALEINHATGDSLRLTYNDSNGSATDYTDFALGSDGALTITSTGQVVVDEVAKTVAAVSQRVYIDSTNAITTNIGATAVYSLTIDEPNIIVGTATPTTSASLYISGAATEATTNYGIQLAAMTGATSTGLNIGNMSGATTNTGINIGTLGTATTSKGIVIGALSSATSTGIDIGAFTGATTNTGINITSFATGTTSKGIVLGTNSSATATGIDIGALSGTTANIGVKVGAISGASGTGTGVDIGAFTNTGATQYGVNIGAFSGTHAAGGGITAGVNIGNISSAGTTSSNYGLLLGTMTGGTTANYQISTGVLTSATTTTNAQLNLGGVVTTGGTTNYGINVGALSGTGTTNYGINVAASTATGTTNYGMKIGAISGAATNNYGLYVDTVSGAGTGNNAAIFAGGNVGIGATAPAATLEITGNLLLTKETARTISIANSTTADTAGGALTISGGGSTGTGAGGALTLAGGTSGANSAVLASQFTAANSEWLDILDNASLDTGDIDFTFSAWVYFDTVQGASSYNGIIAKRNTTAVAEYTLYESNNTLSFGVSPTGLAGSGVEVSSTVTPVAGTWYFIVAWHDSVANTINISVNGTVTSAPHTTGVLAGNNNLYIGTLQANAWLHNGRIADVGFWKKVLTANERTTLYNSGNGLTYAGLSGSLLTSLTSYWNLSESSGNRADSAGSNTLTDNNTVTGNPGPAAASTGAGGAIAITSGSGGSTSGNSGNLTLNTGTVTSGTVGSVIVQTGGTERLAISPTGTVFNDPGNDVDFRVESDTNANIFTVDAGALSGVGSVGIGRANNATGFLTLGAGQALTAPADATFTQVYLASGGPITIPTGTAPFAASLYIEEPNLTATGTITVAATVVISNAPTEGSSNYALLVDAGTSRLDGTVLGADNWAIGSADDSVILALNASSITSTTSQYNILANATLSNAATSGMTGGQFQVKGAAGAPTYTTSIATSMYLDNASAGSGQTITTQYGLYVANMTTGGTSDYGIYIAGADTYALWVDAGTSRFDGDIGLAGTTVKLAESSGAMQLQGTSGGATDSFINLISDTTQAPIWIYASTSTLAGALKGDSSGNLTVDSGAGLLALRTGATTIAEGASRAEFSSTGAVFNEPSNDYDFRVESDGNANLIMVDAGLNTIGFGAVGQAGTFFSIAPSGGSLDFANANGVGLYMGAATINDTSGAATIDGVPYLGIGIPTYTSTNAMTYTKASSLFIEGVPVGTGNVTISNAYALFVGAGRSRFDGDIIAGQTTFGLLDTVATTINFGSAATTMRIGAAASNIGVGGAAGGEVGLYVRNAFTSATDAYGIFVDPALTPGANRVAQIVRIAGTIVEAGSGTHSLLSGLHITPPAITTGVALVTNTASLYISDAPTATVTGANYALWVDAGLSRFDGGMILGSTQITSADHGGTTATVNEFQMLGVSRAATTLLIGSFSTAGAYANAPGPGLTLFKSKSGTVGTVGAVANGDFLGEILWKGDDGIDFKSNAASIYAEVDGTPGTGDMPGRLVFATTADGAESPSERMRINSVGNVIVNNSLLADANDSAVLGASGTGFSDLFLAEGGIIDWDSSDMTLTQVGDKLTIAGGSTFIADGNALVIGHTAQIPATSTTPAFQILGTALADGSMTIGRFGTQNEGPIMSFTRSPNTTIGSHTIVADNDVLGVINWDPDDGIDFDTEVARFQVEVDDASPAAGDIGVAFVWKQMPGGGGAQAETMRLTAAGSLQFNQASDIIMPANTAAALELSDGTTKFLAFDTRTTTSTLWGVTLNTPTQTLASGGAAWHGAFNIGGYTINATGATNMTQQQITAIIGSPTINSDTATMQVDNAIGLYVGSPVEGTNVTIVDNVAIKIPNGTGSPTNQYGLYVVSQTNGGTNYAIYTGGGVVQFTCTAGAAWTPSGANPTCSDYAEVYPTNDTTLEAGDVIALDTAEAGRVTKSSVANQKQIVGVYSTSPGVLIGPTGIINAAGDNAKLNEGEVPVALTGRVPVKVSIENGVIAIGDYLTSSSTPGIAMKATQAGRVIGMALEAYDSPDAGKVMIFVNPHWLGNDLSVSDAGGQLVNIDPEQLRTGLATLGLTVNPNGVLEVDTLKARKVATKFIELTDQQSGVLYCTWIQSGEWVKVQGECDTISFNNQSDPLPPEPLPVPPADSTPPPSDTTAPSQTSSDTPLFTSDSSAVIGEPIPADTPVIGNTSPTE